MKINSTNDLFEYFEKLKFEANDKHISVKYDFIITKMEPENWKTVPIIINSYNRKQYIEKQIAYLKSKGYKNIYILDNNSSYLPLIEFYKTENLRVFYLSKNMGYLALWETSVFDLFKDEYYVYTDSDVIPNVDVPCDFVEHFSSILNKYDFLEKVGFSLELNDLPKQFKVTEDIINHEIKFWFYGIDEKFYFAPIDTTFALYRPNVKGGWWLKAGRVQKPYVARHLPWYEDRKSLSEDDTFYYRSINKSTHWSSGMQKKSLAKKIKKFLKKCLIS